MLFKFIFLALLVSTVAASPVINEANYKARETKLDLIARGGDCTFADGSPTIKNGATGCSSSGNGLGKSGSTELCTDGVLAKDQDCNIFRTCKGGSCKFALFG